MGSPLSRVPMSAVMSATSSTPDLFSLPGRMDVLFNDTSEQFVTSFAIDLVDLNLFYIRHESVFLVTLSGTQSRERREFMLGTGNVPLPLITSYQDFAFSCLSNFLGFVVTQMVESVANVVENQALSQFADLEFFPTANSMFRESLQPLPGELREEGVLFDVEKGVRCA